MSYALNRGFIWPLLAILLGTFTWAVVLVPAPAWADGEEPAAEQNDGDAQKEEAEEPPHLDGPRATFETFLPAYHKKNFKRAAACLDFSKVEPTPNDKAEIEYMQQLLAVMDRNGRVEYSDLPEDVTGDSYTWQPKEEDTPITVVRGADGMWRFDAELVASLPDLYEAIKDKPIALEWHQRIFLGTPVWKFGIVFLSLLIGWILGRILKSMLAGSGASLEKRNREYTGVMLKALSRAAVPLMLTLGLSIGMEFLRLHEVVRDTVDTVIAVLFAIGFAYALYCLVDVIAIWLKHFSQKTDSKLDDMLAPMVTTTARGTIIVLALVQIATILSDKPMTSVIAGLGVGGLAIGLAAQDMIKNFFGSLMIFSDQPFELGDRVVISGVDGTVESVGFRSTRIRTLDGHLVTMPNGDVANSAVRNVTARPNIKRSFSVTVTYDTPPEKVQRALEILEEILKDHEGMDGETPPRIYFNDMTDIALSIQVIYWYHPPDYWAYCAFSQWVNFEILQRFNAEGIEFAFPTQTLFLAGDPNRPLNTATP